MNHPSKLPKLPKLPALTIDLLHNSGLLIDNVFATLWKTNWNEHPSCAALDFTSAQGLRLAPWFSHYRCGYGSNRIQSACFLETACKGWGKMCCMTP